VVVPALQEIVPAEEDALSNVGSLMVPLVIDVQPLASVTV
jgi:hypothetical protein